MLAHEGTAVGVGGEREGGKGIEGGVRESERGGHIIGILHYKHMWCLDRVGLRPGLGISENCVAMSQPVSEKLDDQTTPPTLPLSPPPPQFPRVQARKQVKDFRSSNSFRRSFGPSHWYFAHLVPRSIHRVGCRPGFLKICS